MGKYTVEYAVAGLEQIQPTTHDDPREALKAARDFIVYYNSAGSKKAGEKMETLKNGYALKHPQGGTVAIATVSSPSQQKNRMREGNENAWVNQLTVNDYQKLKKLYDKAVKTGQTQFVFGQQTLMTEYVKYILQYLAPKFQGIRENDGTPSTNLIDGQSNNVAASRVNKVLAELSRGMFSDESWQAINKIFEKLSSLGLNVTVTSAKYGGHADTQTGMPKFKEWQISIPFTNNKGKPVQLVGQITAHGAGSIEQPLDRYDITAYVSAVNVK